MRMTLETCAEFAQSLQLVYREISGVRHSGIKYRTNMTIGKDEAIAIFPGRILGIMLERMEIEIGEDIGHIERAGSVTRLGLDQRLDDRTTDIFGLTFEESDLVVGERGHLHIIIHYIKRQRPESAVMNRYIYYCLSLRNRDIHHAERAGFLPTYLVSDGGDDGVGSSSICVPI